MKEQVNRVAQALAEWREKESRFEKLFPDTLVNNRPFLRDKLDYLNGIQARFSRSSNEEERLTLNILKRQREVLTKAVYPNLFARMLHYILLPFRQREIEKVTQRRSENNLVALKDTVYKAGFGQVAQQLEQQVKQGQNSFSIPLSYYVNEKERMDYNLSFSKDGAGLYQLDGYKAVLGSSGNRAEERTHNFQRTEGLLPTADQAHGLLAGRSVNIAGQKWIQLDLNDKDVSGNYKIKMFPGEYGYDLNRTIQQLPIKEITRDTKDKLVGALKNGARQEVMLKQGKQEMKVYVEANPQHKIINVFDDQQKKLSIAVVLDQLNGKQQKQPRIIELKPGFGKGKKNGHKI